MQGTTNSPEILKLWSVPLYFIQKKEERLNNNGRDVGVGIKNYRRVLLPTVFTLKKISQTGRHSYCQKIPEGKAVQSCRSEIVKIKRNISNGVSAVDISNKKKSHQVNLKLF